VYLVGAIYWQYQTGKKQITEGPRAATVHYLPTENSAELMAAARFDRETADAEFPTHASTGAALTIGADKRHAILDMRRERSTLDDEPGLQAISFGTSGKPGYKNQRRFASHKLWGYAGLEQITLYELS